MYIRKLNHPELQIDTFTTAAGQSWCILGDNFSGIDRFLAILGGNHDNCVAEILDLPEHPEILSFQHQQEFYEAEMRNDNSDFLDRIDPGTLVREYLPDSVKHLPLLKTFGLDTCLDLGYRQLSSGQSRKLLLLKKLTSGVQTLLLQNPYDGLDDESCRELNLFLRQLCDTNIELMIFINSENDIPPWCSHLALFEAGQMSLAGRRQEIPSLVAPKKKAHTGNTSPLEKCSATGDSAAGRVQREELIYLRDGFAAYGENILFRGLDLVLHTGDHTLITGPNGCGKSTLLDIITGDNPKCYANRLRIFGRQRGSGESIWDIKRQMGIVSPSLHRSHRIPVTVLQVILSGLHDSIGLYASVHRPEIKTARAWLDWISLSGKTDLPFKKLSFAEQRLVLIARALIKRPKLLIFDEPTQGLDDINRNTLLDLLEKIADQQLATILFVSHRKDEQRPFFRQRIRLETYAVT
ncbi:MAG: ATP-binding cassette domain-containing protein [Desulforhopalus sp.]